MIKLLTHLLTQSAFQPPKQPDFSITKKQSHLCNCLILKVIRLGFEPKTHSLEGCCSIQLSYRTGLYLCSFAMGAKVGAKIVFFI